MSTLNYQQLLIALPNHGGTMLVNGKETLFSFLELSKPTGKYVARFVIRLVNVLMRKHYFRFLGNSCTPAIVLSEIEPDKGIQQFDTSQNTCGLIIANILGSGQIKEGIVIPADPFMMVHIPPNWKNFEDYKSAMSSKYRVRTNRVYALSAEITYRNLNEEGLENWLDPCAHLLLETLKNKTITIGKDLRLLLSKFHQILGNSYQINGYFKNNKLIGFISYIQEDKNIFAMHLGYEVGIGTEVHLYQRMMYDLIIIGIQAQVETINLGRTAPEIKSTLGAIPVENSFVFFSKTNLLKWIIQFYANRVHQPLKYTLRHPFKTEKQKS